MLAVKCRSSPLDTSVEVFNETNLQNLLRNKQSELSVQNAKYCDIILPLHEVSIEGD